ncbi:MAG: hypothetical protein L3J09_08975 [Flavobacteriaceae bacterium]|nr:hypothetical protein [Flavobacteriaceae bacterium]
MIEKLFTKTTFKELVSVSIPYVLIFILLLNLLYEYLGGMKILVIIYALVIMVTYVSAQFLICSFVLKLNTEK